MGLAGFSLLSWAFAASGGIRHAAGHLCSIGLALRFRPNQMHTLKAIRSRKNFAGHGVNPAENCRSTSGGGKGP